MQLIENKILALALAFALLLVAVPVGLAHTASQGWTLAARTSKSVLSKAASGNQVYMPLVAMSGPAAVVPGAGAGWLDYVNYYRALAWLPAVSEDTGLSIGAQQLAACIVASNKYHEYEWQFSPDCQPFGTFQTTAQSSDLYVTSTPDATDAQALATWMQAPFHALGILDPALQRVGFGSDRDASGAVRMAAALNVTAGRNTAGLSAEAFPVMWPGPHATVPGGSYAADTDSPEPLSSCAGYPAVTGLPIILQTGDGSAATMDITDSSVKADGASLEYCRITQTSYTNLDADEQAAGRQLLRARNAIILMPKNPLVAGPLYTVSITANGRVYQWSFQVAGN